MIVQQYVVPLPADYDMGIIRKRVSAKAATFDALPGLGLNVFLTRERGRFGAESNQYAPMYLWPTTEPVWGFLAGEGFAGVLDSFGWTRVQQWLGMSFGCVDIASLSTLRSVTRKEQRIEPGTDLAALRDREIAETRKLVARKSELLVRAVGVNPADWSLVRFDGWSCTQGALPEGCHSYEVLHVSAPSAEQLRAT